MHVCDTMVLHSHAAFLYTSHQMTVKCVSRYQYIVAVRLAGILWQIQ
jgi:hypothetical protein